MEDSVLIKDIMSQYLITVTNNTTVDEVLSIFERNSIHHLPVLEDDKLVGIISKIDVYKITHCIDLFRNKANEEYNQKLLSSMLAEEIMTKDVVVLSPDDTVHKAAALFSQNLFHALPVVIREKLVGIVSTFDLIEWAFNQKLKPATL